MRGESGSLLRALLSPSGFWTAEAQQQKGWSHHHTCCSDQLRGGSRAGETPAHSTTHTESTQQAGEVLSDDMMPHSRENARTRCRVMSDDSPSLSTFALSLPHTLALRHSHLILSLDSALNVLSGKEEVKNTVRALLLSAG